MDQAAVDLTAVAFLGGHRVSLSLRDGARRVRDLSLLLTGPLFDAIRADPAEFAQARIDRELGVLCWPSGIDVDAEPLRYDDLWTEAVGLARTA